MLPWALRRQLEVSSCSGGVRKFIVAGDACARDHTAIKVSLWPVLANLLSRVRELAALDVASLAASVAA